ncbi:26S proteasome regulatory subunit N6 [Vigna unguiculata]|uniref:26S proteasome regulatory subunit N6 n=1 Tax=Vigna unguiculata TaxID=3917 RepID=A0A4D6MKD0_VIGUN|nr:26S proteasome regulatory subunit N6 [Vigna unguiculata]
MDSYFPATVESIILAEETQDPYEKISILCRVLRDPSSTSFTLSIKEVAIVHLIEQFTEENRAVDLRSLLTHLRFFFSLIPTEQTAKVMRRVIDSVGEIPGSSDLQITICKDMVQWARAERRRFLRLRLERRLAALLEEKKEYSEALALLNNLQSGILYAEEKDYNTAYSYFREAFGHFCSIAEKEDPRVVLSLKYMMLCKIMVDQAQLVPKLISFGATCVTTDLAAMRIVADAVCRRSLQLFQIVLRNYKPKFEGDANIFRHLSSLDGVILEYKLRRLVEPFSRVEIVHVSELIGLPVDDVERKLYQMILDKKLGGKLDQSGCLVIFDDPETDALYTSTFQTISNIEKVVDSLYARSAKIIA